MKLGRVASIVFSLGFCSFAFAQQATEDNMSQHAMRMDHDHHGAAVAVTFGELTGTAAQLEKARRATEKYRDVRVAEADGYKATGPDVAGMGIHYVGPVSGFDLERPPILLYEKDATQPGGFALVGVSYLLKGEADVDGQPKHAPFPKSLASWHRHENICLLPDRSTPPLSESECTDRGGKFTPETDWMIHAWIWKDSPTGVFSPTNPTVK